MWWRVFIPSWRFFDSAGLDIRLWENTNDGWVLVKRRPRPQWHTLFFNPRGNFHHACANLLERLVLEVSEGAKPEELVSYALVREIMGTSEFKITVNGEDYIHGGV